MNHVRVVAERNTKNVVEPSMDSQNVAELYAQMHETALTLAKQEVQEANGVVDHYIWGDVEERLDRHILNMLEMHLGSVRKLDND